MGGEVAAQPAQVVDQHRPPGCDQRAHRERDGERDGAADGEGDAGGGQVACGNEEVESPVAGDGAKHAEVVGDERRSGGPCEADAAAVGVVGEDEARDDGGEREMANEAEDRLPPVRDVGPLVRGQRSGFGNSAYARADPLDRSPLVHRTHAPPAVATLPQRVRTHLS